MIRSQSRTLDASPTLIVVGISSMKDREFIATNNKLLLEKVIDFWFCIVLCILLDSPFKKISDCANKKKMANIFFYGHTQYVIKNGLVQSRHGSDRYCLNWCRRSVKNFQMLKQVFVRRILWRMRVAANTPT